MFIAWFVRGAGFLSGVTRKGWTRVQLLDFERRLMAGGLPGMRGGNILVSWDDDGPAEWLRVVPVDGRDVSPRVLDKIEAAVKRLYAGGDGNA